MSDMHPSSEKFLAILKEMGDLHTKKSADYGSDVDPLSNLRTATLWGIPAWVGCMNRANDKVARLQTLAKKGSLTNESARDAFLDLAVYSIIGLILFEELAGEGPDETVQPATG